MSVKISELPFVTAVSGSDLVVVVQAGVTSHASASAVGGGPPILAGNIRRQEIDDLLLETETKLGAFTFNPSQHEGPTLYLEMVGTLTSTGSLATTFDLRMYDMGAPASPQAGDLRASISTTASGTLRRDRFPLTASSSPTTPGSSPDDATIYDSERIYEIRGWLSGNVGDLIELDWTGVRGEK